MPAAMLSTYRSGKERARGGLKSRLGNPDQASRRGAGTGAAWATDRCRLGMSVALEQPVWLRRVTQPGAAVFAVMFSLESLSRSTLAALIPLQAYALLQEARDVSLTYFC